MVLVKQLAAGQTRAGNRMVESLGLRLRGRRGNKSSLGFGRRGSRRKKRDLFADSAAKVLERLLDIRGVVVCFVLVLRTAPSGSVGCL